MCADGTGVMVWVRGDGMGEGLPKAEKLSDVEPMESVAGGVLTAGMSSSNKPSSRRRASYILLAFRSMDFTITD